MATQLGLDEHLEALVRAGAALREAAAKAGLDAKVPTCPAWDVGKLVIHQGMVHRWAAANLRGEKDHDTTASQEDGRAAPDLLDWFATGLDALIDTILKTPEDAKAMVFLNDAPPPRRFWARRQAHETTIHSVDAISAALGRMPRAEDTEITPNIATDGIDELLTGFITRGKGRLRSDQPYRILVRASDTGQAWTVRISDGPVVTTLGDDQAEAEPEVTFDGTAAQLYLGLWNRGEEITTNGREDALDTWRSEVRVRWS